jgi:tetratricopeptide (TPR) repeat protein
LLGDLLLADGRLAEAEKLLKYSVEALEEAAGKYPKYIGYREEAASALQSLGRLHQAAGRTGDAEKAFGRSIALYEDLGAQKLDRACYFSQLADLLVGRPTERLRDARRAVELARKALEVQQDSSPVWITLGVAHYQQGHWNAAAAALEKGLSLNHPDTGRGAFYLAMTYARQGKGDQARRAYEQAVQWMDTNEPRNPDLLRLRAQAEEVLKVVAERS